VVESAQYKITFKNKPIGGVATGTVNVKGFQPGKGSDGPFNQSFEESTSTVAAAAVNYLIGIGSAITVDSTLPTRPNIVSYPPGALFSPALTEGTTVTIPTN